MPALARCCPLPCSCHPSAQNKDPSVGTAANSPGRWQRDPPEPKLPQRKMFVEPQPQAVLGWVNQRSWCSILLQPDHCQHPSSRDNPGSSPRHPERCPGDSDASHKFYAIAAISGLPHPVVEIGLLALQEAKSHQLSCFNKTRASVKTPGDEQPWANKSWSLKAYCFAYCKHTIWRP